jgi:hypothetical protein
MWDVWLVERSFKIFVRAGTAILFLRQLILLNHELEGMKSYLNTFPDATLISPDILIATRLSCHYAFPLVSCTNMDPFVVLSLGLVPSTYLLSMYQYAGGLSLEEPSSVSTSYGTGTGRTKFKSTRSAINRAQRSKKSYFTVRA